MATKHEPFSEELQRQANRYTEFDFTRANLEPARMGQQSQFLLERILRRAKDDPVIAAHVQQWERGFCNFEQMLAQLVLKLAEVKDAYAAQAVTARTHQGMVIINQTSPIPPEDPDPNRRWTESGGDPET